MVETAGALGSSGVWSLPRCTYVPFWKQINPTRSIVVQIYTYLGYLFQTCYTLHCRPNTRILSLITLEHVLSRRASFGSMLQYLEWDARMRVDLFRVEA